MTPTQSGADNQAHGADKPPVLSIVNEMRYRMLLNGLTLWFPPNV